jgi:hypothetical protein
MNLALWKDIRNHRPSWFLVCESSVKRRQGASLNQHLLRTPTYQIVPCVLFLFLFFKLNTTTTDPRDYDQSRINSIWTLDHGSCVCSALANRAEDRGCTKALQRLLPHLIEAQSSGIRCSDGSSHCWTYKMVSKIGTHAAVCV